MPRIRLQFADVRRSASTLFWEVSGRRSRKLLIASQAGYGLPFSLPGVKSALYSWPLS